MAEVGQDPTLSLNAVSRLGRFARSRRFQLGRPRDFALAPGRLLFLRSLAANEAHMRRAHRNAESPLSPCGAGPGRSPAPDPGI